MTDILISSLVENQLPEFIREENTTFVTFLKKYYEWLEKEGNAIQQSKAVSEANDVDLADDVFVEKIKQELLPFFPKDLLLDKAKFIKLSNEYYKSKGTPQAVKFLFRILYNEEISIHYPGEQILKASNGKWVLPLALRVTTGDPNILNIEKTKITGSISKATAIVEKAIKSIDRQLGIEYVELYISNVNKLFTTGETITTHITGNTSVAVTGTLVGSLSEIKIDPKNRGLFYNGYDATLGYEGDPVTIIGGLNTNSSSPVGAVATVGEVLKGSVKNIVLKKGGFGFRYPQTFPNSSIIDFKGGFTDGVLGSEAKAQIMLLDEKYTRNVNVSDVEIETMYNNTINAMDNIANNKTISQLTTFQSLELYPISFVDVVSSGGGYKSKPSVDIGSYYLEDIDDTLIINSCTAVKGSNVLRDSSQDLRNSFEIGDNVRLFLKNRFEEVRTIANVSIDTITLDLPFENNIDNLSVYKMFRRNLTGLGSLGRIEILNGGHDYNVGEYLIFTTKGRGYGANAQITEVHAANNGIKAVEFNENTSYVRGGEGYEKNYIPTITINTAHGSNASLVVSEILGDGEDFDISTTRIGAISTLRVLSYGYDYVESPTISLRNANMVVDNVTAGLLFVANTKVYQGSSNVSPDWYAYVDGYTQANNFLRIYNYRGVFDPTKQIISDENPNNIVTANVVSVSYYGDGKAKATAKFENGLIRYPGIYLNQDGQLSADQKLQDSVKYHNFSYVINTENDYVKFKKALNDAAHPIGTKAFVVRIDTNEKQASNLSSNVISIVTKTLANTFNISNGSNNMVATGANANLISVVSVGDHVILSNVRRQISGTGNVRVSSNTITGNSSNFINDLLDGDTITLSTGNTGTVLSVINANTVYMNTNFNITSNDATISLVFDEVKRVTFVNANTILVDTNFTTNSTFVTTIHQKVE